MLNGVKVERPKAKSARASRPYHRMTILTTDKRTFDRIEKMKEGVATMVECPNDIISSARGGKDNEHHSVRRVSLLRRQLNAGYRRVRVRWEQGHEISCVLTGVINGAEDMSVFSVGITK